MTVEEQRNVTLTIDGSDGNDILSCSNRCNNLECAAECPTARVEPGACAGPDTAKIICRSFVELQTYKRPGTCDDPEAPGVRSISCVDPKEHEKHIPVALMVLWVVGAVLLGGTVIAIAVGMSSVH